jgi:hypothetical protein
MFRTGGPIKEGVMNGLREGGVATTMADATMMAGGGMPNMRGRVTGPGGYAGKKEGFLKRNYGKLLTGGGATQAALNAPEILEMLRFFYKDGGVAGLPPMRGMVTGPGKYSQDAMKGFGGALKGDIEQRIKKNPAKAGKIGTYVAPAVKAGVRKYLPSLEGIGGRTMGGIKNLFRKIEMPPKRISTGAPYGTNLTQAQIAQGMGTRPATFLERVNMFRKANPRTFYGGLGVGTTSGAIPYVGGKLAEGVGNLGLQVADLAVSDKFFDQDKVIGSSVKDIYGRVKKKLGFEEDKVPPPDKGGPKPVIPKEKTPAEIAAEKEIKDKQKLDKIYSLLGVDRAKRNAASKALIDMSRYIDEGGKDVISKKNIGSTISKAIGAFDKRLDKVDQLKEAAGLMIAKGEIEKELYKEKGNASTQQINALAKASGRSPAYVANAKLGIANSPSEAKAQLAKLKNVALTSDSVTAVIQQYADENNIKFQKQITTDQKNDKVGKGKEYATVVDLVEDLKLDPKGSDDGLYVIGTSIVQVDKGVAKLKG